MKRWVVASELLSRRCGLRRRGDREADRKGRALAHRALDANPASVIVDDLLACRQAQARATFARCIRPRFGRKETVEDFRQNLLWDSLSVVPDRQDHRVGLRLMLDDDSNRAIFFDRLPCVGDQVQ